MIIACGTGGIKPCVSAFGGNQFKPNQKKYLTNFFSVFYISINIGSTIGTIITPILRSDVKCFGHDCYPLAFGVPTLVMLGAIVLFIVGTPFYNRNQNRENGNIIAKTIGCIFNALKNKIKNRRQIKKEHWLDYSDDKYNAQMISDVKAFCRVFLVFLPLPIFWTLYDQQGSRWTEQAQQLNGRVGSFTIKPDQFQAVNPIFIIILVPLFDFVVYPLFSKINIFKRQLQRMAVGLIFACISFGIAAILESKMQSASLALNPPNSIKLINISPCTLNIVYDGKSLNLDKPAYLNNNAVKLDTNAVNKLFKESSKSIFEINPSECQDIDKNFLSIDQAKLEISNNNLPKSLVFYFDTVSNQINFKEIPYDVKEPKIGASQIKFNYFAQPSDNIDISVIKPSIYNSIITYNNFSLQITTSTSLISDYTTVDNADYKFKLQNTATGETLIDKEVLLETCGRYNILVFNNKLQQNKFDFVFLTDVHQNGVHLAWQLIQIFVMTTGEIMFSISGLSFAYSQAPHSMKSGKFKL